MKGTAGFVEGRVNPDSIWAVMHRESHVLFPDELFADLFESTGRRSCPSDRGDGDGSAAPVRVVGS